MTIENISFYHLTGSRTVEVWTNELILVWVFALSKASRTHQLSRYPPNMIIDFPPTRTSNDSLVS